MAEHTVTVAVTPTEVDINQVFDLQFDVTKNSGSSLGAIKISYPSDFSDPDSITCPTEFKTSEINSSENYVKCAMGDEGSSITIGTVILNAIKASSNSEVKSFTVETSDVDYDKESVTKTIEVKNLSATAVVSPATTNTGQERTYGFTVTNNGGDGSDAIKSFTIDVPTDFTSVSLGTDPTGWTCGYTSPTITCTAGSGSELVNTGGSVLVNVTATAGSTAKITIWNVEATGSLGGSQAVDIDSQPTITIQTPPNIAETATIISPATVSQGQADVSFSVNVQNTGEVDVTLDTNSTISFTDTLSDPDITYSANLLAGTTVTGNNGTATLIFSLADIDASMVANDYNPVLTLSGTDANIAVFSQTVDTVNNSITVQTPASLSVGNITSNVPAISKQTGAVNTATVSIPVTNDGEATADTLNKTLVIKNNAGETDISGQFTITEETPVISSVDGKATQTLVWKVKAGTNTTYEGIAQVSVSVSYNDANTGLVGLSSPATGSNTNIFTIDNTSPTISAIFINPAPSSTNNNTPTISFNVSDAGVGIDWSTVKINDVLINISECTLTESVYFCSHTFSALDDGTYTFTISASDNVGNSASDSSLADYVIDTQKPTTSDDYGDKDGVWQSGEQTIILTPVDPAPSSDFAWTKYCTDDGTTPCNIESGTDYSTGVLITTEGTTYFRYASADKAGNVQTTVSRVVMIDTSNPATSAITSPSDNDYIKGIVTITADATDNTDGSGIAKVEFYYGAIKIGEDTDSPYSVDWDTNSVIDNTYSLTAEAIDQAGNPLTSSAVSVTVDNTSPEITTYTLQVDGDDITTENNVFINSSIGVKVDVYTNEEVIFEIWISNDSTKLNKRYWHTTTLSHNITRPTGCSWKGTVNSCNGGILPDGIYKIKIVATDLAENQTLNEEKTITVDNTPPTVSVTGAPADADWIVNKATLTASVECNDSGSDCDGTSYAMWYSTTESTCPTNSSSYTSNNVTVDQPMLVCAYGKDNAGNKDFSEPVYFKYSNTIQAAINAATAGDTISVSDGNYNENLVINKSLTLNGANAGVDPRTNWTSNITIINPGAGNRGITISADGVIINGFEITGVWQGIYTTAGTETSKVVIKNNKINNYGGKSAAEGIWVEGGNVEISQNVIEANSNGAANPTYSVDSIYTKGGATVTVTDNILRNNKYQDSSLTSTSAGLSVHANDTITATGNEIYDNDFGIHAKSGMAANESPTVTANFNKIYNNVMGAYYELESGGDSNPSYDAKNNWWGASSGPSGEGNGAGNAVSANVDFDPWYIDDGKNTLSSTVSLSNIYVDDNYNASACDTAGYVWNLNCFSTIREGIEAVESGVENRGTVNVADGTYTITGKILVNKENITITGNVANPENVVVQYSPAKNDLIFDMRANDVTVEGIKTISGKNGFFFDQSATGCKISHCIVENAQQSGIYIYNGNTHTIEYTRITNPCQAEISGYNNGVYTRANNTTIDHCTITSNKVKHMKWGIDLEAGSNQVVTETKITGSWQAAIRAASGVKPVTITNNDIDDATQGYAYEAAISLAGSNDGSIISGNYIDNVVSSSAIVVYPAWNITIANNQIGVDDSSNDIRLEGIKVSGCGGSGTDRVEIIGNIIHNTGYSAVLLINSNNTYVYNNIIENCNNNGADGTGDWDYASIHVDENSDNVIVDKNDVSDGINGIQVWGDTCEVTNNEIYDMGLTCKGDGDGTKTTDDGVYYNSGIIVGTNWLTSNVKPVGTTITGNNIHDNYYGLYVRDYATLSPNDPSVLSVTAEDNWWGFASGPKHSNNPSGTGDAVSDNVDYRPWHTNSNLTNLDEKQPDVTITSTASPLTNTLPIPMTVKFTEAVTNFVAEDITVGNGTVGTLATSDNKIYTTDITPSGQGAITVDIPVDVAWDLAGNYNTAASQFSIVYDSEAPIISKIEVSPNSGTAKVGDTITLTITANAAGYTAEVITVNGIDVTNSNFQDLIIGNYSVDYLVAEGNNDVASGAIMASVILKDEAGNENIAYTTVTNNTLAVDANMPVISSVTSDAAGAGWLKVDDTITFTVDILTAETGLTITPATYNSGSLTWATTDDGDTYTATYVVEEGQSDQTIALQLTGVQATDPAGNVSTAVDGSDVAKTIDANTPTVALLSPLADSEIIGGSTIYISWTAGDDNLGATPIKLEYTIDNNWQTGHVYDITETSYDPNKEYGINEYAWTVPNITSPSCYVRITATDLAGNNKSNDIGAFTISRNDNPTPICTQVTGSDQWTCDIDLNIGWNLISSPVVVDSTPENVFSEISNNLDIVKYYDSTESDNWKSYVPLGSAGDLTTIEDGKGYWINMTGADTLTITGLPNPDAIVDGVPTTPQSYNLNDGWNLIGFRSVIDKTVADYVVPYFDTQQKNYTVWKVKGNGYESLSSSNSMTPGNGYWLSLGQ